MNKHEIIDLNSVGNKSEQPKGLFQKINEIVKNTKMSVGALIILALSALPLDNAKAEEKKINGGFAGIAFSQKDTKDYILYTVGSGKYYDNKKCKDGMVPAVIGSTDSASRECQDSLDMKDRAENAVPVNGDKSKIYLLAATPVEGEATIACVEPEHTINLEDTEGKKAFNGQVKKKLEELGTSDDDIKKTLKNLNITLSNIEADVDKLKNRKEIPHKRFTIGVRADGTVIANSGDFNIKSNDPGINEKPAMDNFYGMGGPEFGIEMLIRRENKDPTYFVIKGDIVFGGEGNIGGGATIGGRVPILDRILDFIVDIGPKIRAFGYSTKKDKNEALLLGGGATLGIDGTIAKTEQNGDLHISAKVGLGVGQTTIDTDRTKKGPEEVPSGEASMSIGINWRF